MNIYVQEEYVNKTQGYRVGDSGVFMSRFETKSEVYKYCLKEHGKCLGKVYVGEGTHVGWIFQKLVKYEDCNEKYLQEVWVTLHKGMPTKTIKYDYL
jgi:hypothetical protein